MRHVSPGQTAEVVMKLRPGQTFTARVIDVVDTTSGAQLQPSGVLPDAPGPNEPPLPFGVILELDEPLTDLGDVMGGALGTAAIYTDSASATHVIRRVMLRMESWMNYLVPY
jgi:hypothetical protein